MHTQGIHNFLTIDPCIQEIPDTFNSIICPHHTKDFLGLQLSKLGEPSPAKTRVVDFIIMKSL